jgi:hypothetical protein
VNRAAVFGQESEVLRVTGGQLSNNLSYMAPSETLTTARVVSRSADRSEPSRLPKTASGQGAGVTDGSGSGTGLGKSGNVGGGAVMSGGGAGGNAPLQAAPSTVSSGLFTINPKEADALISLSPEARKRAELQSKFHPSVLAVINRLAAKNLIAGADESKFIHNGKAEVQIWFTDKSAETIAKLKELGFEVVLDPKSARMVMGRLPIEKLAALADLQSIRYVAPQVSAN